MVSWSAPLGTLALALYACPADPTFVASDVEDTATEGDAETAETVATTTETTSETETVAETDGADAETVDAAETSACPPPCGPLAQCFDGACRCPDDLCDQAITDTPIDELALVMPAHDAPAIVFSEFIESGTVRVARWIGDDWSVEASIVRDGYVALDATTDDDGRIVALTSDENGAAAFSWNLEGGDWAEIPTLQPACHHAAIDFDRAGARAVVGCTSTSAAEFSASVLDGPQGEVALRQPLSLGAAPNPNVVRFRVDATGRTWVAFSEPSTGAASIVVARFESAAWQDEPLESVKVSAGAAQGPPLALALDGVGRVHVVYIAEEHGELVMNHRTRQGVEAWTKLTLPIEAPLDGVTLLDLTAGAGGTVHLLMVRKQALLWAEIDAGEVVRRASLEATLDVIDADLVVDGENAPWVAYAPGRTGARLWRPAGP